jgi:NAD(P)-dependent dehydrogenase (short-subunit alcohol dehydrogenase family)
MNQQANRPYKTVVITGATSGIGLAAAAEIAGEGHHVIGIARSEEKADSAVETILVKYPEAKINYFLTDLSSQTKIRQLSRDITAFLAEEGKESIDVLINNAGAVTSWFTLTEDGYELQFAVNHLAPFLLTHLLLPFLKNSPNGRILTVSSSSHRNMRIKWKDIMMRRNYRTLMAYKQSKLANVLFTYEFNRRSGPDSSVRAYAVDPGLVNTSIGIKDTGRIVNWFWNKRRKKGVIPEIPAETLIHLACRRDLPDTNSWYWKGSLPVQPSKYALREDEAARLWELSSRLCGLDSPSACEEP